MTALGSWTENAGLCVLNNSTSVDEGQINADPETNTQPWQVIQVTNDAVGYLETKSYKQVAVSRESRKSWCTDRTLPGGQIGEHTLYRDQGPVEYVHHTRLISKNCYATGCWVLPVLFVNQPIETMQSRSRD